MQNTERILRAAKVKGQVTDKGRPARLHLTFQWKQSKPGGLGQALCRH